MAIGNQHDGRYAHEGASIPIVTPEELRATSQSLWQDEQYAAIAPAFFAINDRNAYEIRRRPYMTNAFGDTSGHLGWTTTKEAVETTAVEAWVTACWNKLQLPYALEMQWDGPDNEVLTCRAGAMMRRQLYEWAIDPQHSRNTHTLHGAVGKALDVLRVAAGAVAASQIDASKRVAAGTYIPYATFIDILKSSRLSYDLKKGLPERVEWGLVHQLRYGRPVGRTVFAEELEGATPEIILEGRVALQESNNPAGRPIAIGLIAVNSLKGLASRHKRSPRLMDFLRQLSRELEA